MGASTIMSDQTTRPNPYTLTVDGLDDDYFSVRRFTGKEAMSSAYAFAITVRASAAGGDEVERDALGQSAVFTWSIEDKSRTFYGVIASVRVAGTRDNDTIEYILRFVPRLWLLKKKRKSRIFQNMRVPDVVTAVLLEQGIATRWQLSKVYPVREYCTQYEETDFRFVTRILAEAGIYFYFPEGGPVDSALQTMGTIAGTVGSVGGSVVSGIAGSAAGSVVESAASAVSPLLPGDTVICGDDSVFYPPLGPDDAAALEASTAAAMAPEVGQAIGSAVGGMSPVGGAVLGEASAVAGSVVGALTSSDPTPLNYLMMLDAPVSRTDKVTRFSLRTAVRATSADYREFDPARPLTLLEDRAVSISPFPESAIEAAADVATTAGSVVGSVAPGVAGEVGSAVAANAASVANALEGIMGDHPLPNLEIYDHHDPYLFPKWTLPSDEAPRMLRQARRRATVAVGESGAPDLEPGHKFALVGHPVPRLDQPYVVTEVEHRGQSYPEGPQGQRYVVYENSFECVPAVLAFVPPKPRRRSVQVTLTAIVVGPKGTEIYVDPLGQIRVQFHWDRDGKNDDRSSCWIRTMHPWAGPSWGVQFIPRIGMEVVVVFEGGDPDKPMVIGSVYNATHPPPFALPANATRSGWRTQSTPQAEGFNELSFDDTAGSEQVFLHAQKNYDEVVLRDQTSKVGGGRLVDVAESTSERVGKSASLTVGTVRSASVGGDDRLDVGGTATVHVKGDLLEVVDGDARTTVGRQHTLEVHGNRALVVGQDGAPAHSDHYVYGTSSFAASERLILRATDGLLLQCGDASIELTKDKIVLNAPTLELSPTKSFSAATKGGPSVTIDDKMTILAKKFGLFTESGAVEVDTEFKVKADAIKLGYDPTKPTQASDSADVKTKSFTCKFSDYFLNPYAGKTYHLMVEGLRLEGQTDGEGTVKQDIPDQARQVVVKLWIDSYPEGAQRHYTLKLGDLPATSDLAGLKRRLKNLGYFEGVVDSFPTDDLRFAVSQFQEDHKDSHGLDITGEADGATASALEDVHGS